MIPALSFILYGCMTYVPIYNMQDLRYEGSLAVVQFRIEGEGLLGVFGSADLVDCLSGKIFQGKARSDGFIVFDSLPSGTYAFNNLLFPTKYGLDTVHLKPHSREIKMDGNSVYFLGIVNGTQEFIPEGILYPYEMILTLRWKEMPSSDPIVADIQKYVIKHDQNHKREYFIIQNALSDVFTKYGLRTNPY